MARVIQSPGVEIKEHDLSENTSTAIGTYIFTTGFADKGPTDEILQITSKEEFEQIYGLPTTPAERYFYHSVTQQFNSPANVLVSRLPYGIENGEGFCIEPTYSILAYPVVDVTGKSLQEGDRFIICKPKHLELTEQQYLELQDGVEWNNSAAKTIANFDELGNAGIIIVNKSQTTINDQYEGYYVGIADNIACEPSSKYQSIMSVQSVASLSAELYTQLPSTRMNFTLSANGGDVSGSSISQIMEDSSSFDIFGSEFDDTLIFNIFKLRKSLYADSTIKLDANLSESYVASVDFYRQMQSQNGGSPVSFFIEKKSEDSSDVQILVNPYLSGKKSGKTWLGDDGKPTKKIRVAFGETNTEFTSANFDDNYADRYGAPYETVSSYMKDYAADALYALGVYQEANGSTKVLGSIPNKVSRALSKISNIDLFDLDVTCEAGLGTIWAYYKEAQAQIKEEVKEKVTKEIKEANPKTEGEADDAYNKRINDLVEDELPKALAKACEFDDESTTVYESASAGNWFKTGQDTFDGNGGKDNGLCENYKAIYNLFANFASNERKDHVFIADPLRFIFLQGSNKKTLSDKSKNFSQHIYWPLRYNFFTANTSYAAAYANWGKVYDTASDGNVWIPMSGVLATTYANTDSNYYCWYAPAGPDRGILTTIIDLALSPKQKERDQLYKISLNPIYQDPNMGYVVFGQKTLQSKPSSFDRISVRRLFLYLEKSTYKTIKWFLFRNNTYSTRMAIVNTLNPIFRSCKQNEGLYDYRLVCSEVNNTPDVIDANELKVSIYLQSVRTAEFILVDFYSTKTGTNFDELIK